jgi:glutathione peroxidase
MLRNGLVDLLVLALIAAAFGTLQCREQERSAQSEAENTTVESLYDLKTSNLDGRPVDLGEYCGKVALVVNLASKCGLTPQYEGIEALCRELSPRGFVVLGFPSNDFANQEPGSPEEIREFCTTNYDVTFPLFEKVRVKGSEKSQLYRFLTSAHDEPDWNFTKYLVDHEGRVVQRFAPQTKPDDPELRRKIEALLAEKD